MPVSLPLSTTVIPNTNFQLWPGQFVNVRLKVETLAHAVVVPTSAVQARPRRTFSYVIGDGDIVTAKRWW